ncbi:MAG: CHASE domain-containing protein [Lachnospiraceae bacterium]|nr:CHASE domain-containing protein [Lachnospiraceae bacterium]
MKTEYNKQLGNSMKKAVLSTLISFILLTALYYIILQHDLADDKERYGYIARNQAEHIVTTIDCVMSRTNTLKTLIKENNGDTTWFNNVAKDIYISIQDETGVSPRNFAIAPGGVVSDVYPLDGNEELIGFNFMDTSREGNLEAKEAYENGKTIITNPFELIQGGIGMGGRAPVVLQNDDNTSLWGLVTITIDFDNLIKVLGLDNLQGMGVDYSLSYIDPDGRAQFMYGDRNLGNNTVKTQFSVRNLTWEIDVKPSKGWVSVWDIVFSMCIILIISCFAGILENVNSIVDGWKGHIVDKMSISIGHASHREFPDMTIEELGKTADKKMYEAKKEYYQKHDRRRRI